MKKLILVALMAALLVVSATAFAAPAPFTLPGAVTLDFSTSAVTDLAFTGAVGLGQGFALSISNDPDVQLNIDYKFSNLGDTPLKLMVFAGIQSNCGFGSSNSGRTYNNSFGGQVGVQFGIPLGDGWQAYVMGNIGSPAYKFNGGVAYTLNEKVDMYVDVNYVNMWHNNDWNNDNGVFYPSVGMAIKL
ncbi:MAG: hypothetical protein WCV63_05525 [Negativicutes bacterium]|jgi:hypothetical protein